jgi:predicted AAA+ superfamily ATPase
MFISRKIQTDIKNFLFKNKAIIIYGARQTGKTSLVKNIVENSQETFVWLNADESDVANMLSNQNSAMLKTIFGNNKIIIIDEAQRVKNIGITLKIIIDTFPEYQVIATGSSSFELSNKINEPLTGRKWEYHLYPFSFEELSEKNGILNEMRLLEHRLIYGLYPDVVTNEFDSKKIIKSLAESYLYKDILSIEGIQKSDKIIKLLKALALQAGSEISYNELSQIVGVDKKTIEKYIIILEQSFIIFRLNSFSKNLRTELKKAKKVYFFDNGILNAVTGNFEALQNRTDIGILWENYIISERYKYLKNNQKDSELYFWRTNLQQEIDLVEIQNSQISAFEIKWNPKTKAKLSKSFENAYPNTFFRVINRENYINFLTNNEL